MYKRQAIEEAKEAAGIKAPEAGVVTKKPKAPPIAPKIVAPPAAGGPPRTTQVDNFTKAKAWETIVDLKVDECDDDQLNAEWQAAIHEVSGGAGEGTLDGEGWWKVKDTVLANIGKLG